MKRYFNMFIRLLIIVLVSISGFITSSYGQDFEVKPNPLHKTTAGTIPFEPGDESHYFVAMTTYVENTSDSPITITWRNLSTDTTRNPEEWVLVGVCDNILCRSEYGAWYYGETDTAAPIPPGEEMMLITHVYAPTNTPDAVGTYRIELKTANQTDTAVFILRKQASSGVAHIPINDTRVVLYPNPVTRDDLHIDIDPNVKASRVTIYDIIGREKVHQDVDRGNRTTINVSNMPSGLYILRLTNEEGRIITSRKFSKT